MLWNCFAVGLGGALGSIFRYLLGFLPLRQYEFPIITLGINVAGAFLIGLVIALSGRYAEIDPRVILFLQVGFCGGFTTFSTFSNETFLLLQNGKFGFAALYIILSVTLCLCAVFGARFLLR
ncbi:MAG: fluoride efflux transporter CrcB [Firmicutes bacterium]|nr:fluoride efflux transporter CrcB [Bacillota bacterium]